MTKFTKQVIIVGSARSGTSWLCELLAKPYRYRLLFEPEHEFQTKKGHLLCDRWIENTGDADRETIKYLKNIFRNQVDSNWIAQHSNRTWKRHLWPFVPKKIIIKFVRCNLAANFLSTQFKIPVIHIIRNPFEVIESQQRVRFPWLYDLSRFQKQNKLVCYLQKTYGFDLCSLQSFSEIEKLAVRWCIENKISLDFNANNTLYRIIKFEELRNNEDLFTKLCEELQLEVAPNLKKIFNNPSSKSHPRGLKGNSKSQKSSLTSIERQSIFAILKIFKVEFSY